MIPEAGEKAVVQSVPSHSRSATRNVRRMFLLRGLVFFALAIAIAASGFWLGVPAPWWILLAVAGMIGAINLLMHKPLAGPRPDAAFLAQLLVDLVALAALLYFSGGATNPFVWLLLLPLAIIATVLPQWQTWFTAVTVCALYSLLMWFYQPIPDVHMPAGSGFWLHIFGMWIGFIVSSFVIAYFLSGLAAMVRARDRALALAREAALRDEKLVSLGTLAAGAAHELGTPLATMSILVEELADDIGSESDSNAHRKLELMAEQIDRCRQTIAAVVSSTGIEAAQGGCALEMKRFVESVVEEWRTRRSGLKVTCHINGEAPGPRLVVDKSLTGALINIFDNAADASPDDVNIEAGWDDEALAISVSDRGKGFSPAQRARIGKAPASDKPDGHGLGLYLSSGVIGRLGGKLSIRPRAGGGTTVEVELPLAGLTV